MLGVLSDILGALDRGDFAVLTLLDLSVAFDTVDHETYYDDSRHRTRFAALF